MRTQAGSGKVGDIKPVRSFRGISLPEPRDFAPFDLPVKSALDIEVGAGSGDFALLYAEANPTRHLVAIEHTKNRSYQFKKKLAEKGPLNNLTLVHANAISWVSYKLPVASVDTFFFMYPNPNPKKKHQNKRWHAMPFMQKILEVLKADGEICLATNEEWYFNEARDFFNRVWGLSEIEALSFTQNDLPFSEARTLFEKKYLERGETCFQLRLKKGG